MRRRLIPLLLPLLLTASCATAESRLEAQVSCQTTEPGRLILFAEAVPESLFIPCVAAIPVGWSIDDVETKTGRARIVFDNAAYEIAVIATLTAACSLPGSDGPAESYPALQAHGNSFAAAFSGGCLTVDFPAGTDADEVQELVESIEFLSRDELRAATEWDL